MIYGAQFGGVRQQAANLGGSVGNYTAEQFKKNIRSSAMPTASVTCRMLC